jgi:hypothetical protein
MKRSILIATLTVAAFCIATTPAFAQHGRPASPGAATPSTHGSSASVEGGHASSGATSSPNPNSSPSSVFAHSPNLATNLTNALSKSGISVPGGNLGTFCTNNNFKTLGQCIAALHINNKFPSCNFTDLATGIGKALRTCGPSADAKTEARNASKQANQDIKDAKSKS